MHVNDPINGGPGALQEDAMRDVLTGSGEFTTIGARAEGAMDINSGKTTRNARPDDCATSFEIHKTVWVRRARQCATSTSPRKT